MDEIQLLKRDLQELKDEFYLNNFTAHQDFNKYCNFTTRIKVPVYSTLPTNCEVGELVVSGGKLYVASAKDTWTICGTQTA
jgi:hypothetical protein